ncbi:Mor transcription activator family protein [Caldimonas sp. KR1-144]|uniref:Mor transcription activator family protein n=1 Tax=Caldimonas sp. KR1-144 TaxID=3400911 RepID=UPI003BFF519D
MANEHTSMAQRRNELLTDLVDVALRVLRDHDIPEELASVASNAVADRLADHWGGQNITFPKDFFWRLAKVELAIYDDWAKGSTFPELAMNYKMSERGVRKLIARVRAKITDARQTGLFEPPTSS